ncbi:MAG: hypothetical protein AW10_02780 [Candidatus Accumulibacter appositus]|uniref:Uncharacterized protein n=1 Tax=Candidatus Accumulibacter appositus TaxID=1454003 RepID=A0A011PPI2_9PROT|nr:hypothetical protein [Accumulibacter sp.]EXI78790.1 MAG: hypothetical protein AW10_02780 [Candidatus Accumulibacter appositus]HRF05800.1 hypothetical protein [Accumulibacter sp.]
MHETMDMQGRLRLLVEDRQGRILVDRSHGNRIVKTGRELAAQLFAGVEGTPPSKVSHMAVGTGAEAATDDQAALLTERARNPVSAPVYTAIVDPSGVKRIKVSLQTVFDFSEANGAEPLREAGIFTAAKAGTMYNRVVFDAVTKADTFKLTLIWDVVF